MSKKIFLAYKLVTVVVVAVAVSVSVRYGNWYLPIILLLASSGFLYVLSKKVKEVIADERDYRIAGKASWLAMRIYTYFSVVAGLILYVTEKENVVLFVIGNVFIYSACFLMIVYSILFKIYEKKDDRD